MNDFCYFSFFKVFITPRLGLSSLEKCSPFMEKCPKNMDLKVYTWTLKFGKLNREGAPFMFFESFF